MNHEIEERVQLIRLLSSFHLSMKEIQSMNLTARKINDENTDREVWELYVKHYENQKM